MNIVEDAWHGSPHNFKRFSTDYLGSGEGFNTFGWGLYFTGKREVADFYRKKLSRETGGEGYIYNVNLPDDGYLLWDTSLRKQPKPIQTVAFSFLKILEHPPQELRWGTHCEIEPNLRQSSAVIEGRGRTFKVYAEDGTWELLRVFDSLPDAIKAANAKIREQFLRQTGEQFYQDLTWSLGDAKQASLALLGKGIHGIKYLTGNDRKAEHGEYNYVIFDASHVNIKR